MKSYNEFSKRGLSEAVTINDNIWAYLNKEIDGLFVKLKDTIKDMTMPRRDWLKNIHQWLYEKRYGNKNESINYGRLHLTLSEYRNINGLLDEMSSSLQEADTGEDFSHVDGMLDFYKEKFKEIIKNLFARIRVNRKTPAGTATAPGAVTSPLTPTAKPIVSPATTKAPEITKPLQEPEEEPEDGEHGLEEPSNVMGEPSTVPHTPSVSPPAKLPVAPIAHEPEVSPAAGHEESPVGHDEREPNVNEPVQKGEPHHKAYEDELVKLGLVAGMVLVQGWEEGPALDAAEELLDDVKDPKERAQLIKQGQEYLRRKEQEGEPSKEEKPSMPAAATGLKAPEEDQEKTELLAKYHSGKGGQRAIRRLIKKHAPEILAGNYIKGHNVEKIIDAYLHKKRAHGGLPMPGPKETVEHYLDLLRNPRRSVSLLNEAEKIGTVSDRVRFYKERLRLACG